jgi:type I restriction enzyme S subunit
MRTVRLRDLAEVNPATSEFDALDDSSLITFMPLETVWADARLDTSRTISKAEVSNGYVRFRDGDVLTPKVTPTFQAGRSAIVNGLSNGAGAATTEVHVIRARPGLGDGRFLRYRLLAKDFLDEGVASFQGVAGLQRVSAEFVASRRVRPFGLDEQRRIADFLDDQVARIDRLVTLRRAQQVLAAEAYRAEADELLLRSANDDLVPAEWKPFGLVPAHWEQTRLRSVRAILQTGPFGSQLHSDEYVDDGWPVVNPASLQNSRIVALPGTAIDSAVRDRLARHVLREGDVVFGRRGELGRAGLVTIGESGWLLGTGSLLVRLPWDSELVPGYLMRLLATSATKFYFESVAVGSTMANLNVPILGDMPLLLPPREEQQSLVLGHDELESQQGRTVSALTRSVDLLNEYKRSLITAAVTGEFDVTAARTGIPA